MLIFDKSKNEWIEGAEGEELADFIDPQTEDLIKDWCRAQKNNASYI